MLRVILWTCCFAPFVATCDPSQLLPILPSLPIPAAEAGQPMTYAPTTTYSQPMATTPCVGGDCGLSLPVTTTTRSRVRLCDLLRVRRALRSRQTTRSDIPISIPQPVNVVQQALPCTNCIQQPTTYYAPPVSVPAPQIEQRVLPAPKVEIEWTPQTTIEQGRTLPAPQPAPAPEVQQQGFFTPEQPAEPVTVTR